MDYHKASFKKNPAEAGWRAQHGKFEGAKGMPYRETAPMAWHGVSPLSIAPDESPAQDSNLQPPIGSSTCGDQTTWDLVQEIHLVQLAACAATYRLVLVDHVMRFLKSAHRSSSLRLPAQLCWHRGRPGFSYPIWESF